MTNLDKVFVEKVRTTKKS